MFPHWIFAVFNIKCCIYPCHQEYYYGFFSLIKMWTRIQRVSISMLFYIQINTKSRNVLLFKKKKKKPLCFLPLNFHMLAHCLSGRTAIQTSHQWFCFVISFLALNSEKSLGFLLKALSNWDYHSPAFLEWRKMNRKKTRRREVIFCETIIFFRKQRLCVW